MVISLLDNTQRRPKCLEKQRLRPPAYTVPEYMWVVPHTTKKRICVGYSFLQRLKEMLRLSHKVTQSSVSRPHSLLAIVVCFRRSWVLLCYRKLARQSLPPRNLRI